MVDLRGSFDAARDVLDAACRDRVTPAAAAEVGTATGVLWQHAAGRVEYRREAPAAALNTIFDLASLTKVVATTTLAMRLVESGRLSLDAPVRGLVAAWRHADRAVVTVRDLLEHASGLPPVLPVYERAEGRAAVERAICDAPLDYAPRSRSVYSDLGFILLGFIIEDAGAANLRAQFGPVARAASRRPEDYLDYGPVADAEPMRRVAPTQVDEWRGGRLLRGEVDDRNAAALRGVAGHSGLFGTVAAAGWFAREVLRGRQGHANRVAAAGTISRFLTRSAVPGSSRALGWDMMLPTSSCGQRMSAEAFGHTGFTGTSIWIDPVADVYAVLLTNRVHPTAGSGEPIRGVRRAFHDAVMLAVLGSRE